MFKVGDMVALTETHLWAPKGAVGKILEVFNEWDSEDSICWDLNVFFPGDVITAGFAPKHRFGKIAGLYFSDVDWAVI